MKYLKITLIMLFAWAFNTTYLSAQWLNDASGKKTAASIANKAIDAMVNLEYGRAQGLAMAALEIDPNTTSAKIVMAWTSGDALWEGYQKEINAMKMTDSERAWMDVISKPGAEHPAAAKASGSTEPIITYMAAYESYEALEAWTKANPTIAGPAINSLAYADSQGEGPRGIKPPDGTDQERAEQRFKEYIALTDSPNADDSYAEFLASQGDFEGAFDSQLKAFQKLNFISPYRRNLVIYWRKLNAASIEEAVTKRVEAFYNNMEALDEQVVDFLAQDLTITEGMSNMQPWISDNYDDAVQRYQSQAEVMNWIAREAYDIEVALGPRGETAVVTFYMRGSYNTAQDETVVNYHTRASEVWIMQDGEWMLMHSNFAPYGGAAGLPEMN